MSEKNIIDLMISDETGNVLLSRTKFLNEKFYDFTLRPTAGCIAEISDVHFDNCIVTSGTCLIRKGSILRNVVFTDFKCGDAMHISSEVTLDNVKIKGEKYPQMLWIRPQNEHQIIHTLNEDYLFSLDISEFKGEVSITGISTKKVLINTEKHIIVKSKWMDSVNWKELGIGGLSYWKMMAKKVASDRSEEGIFSLPPKNGRNYEKHLVDLQKLKDAGFTN